MARFSKKHRSTIIECRGQSRLSDGRIRGSWGVRRYFEEVPVSRLRHRK